LIALAQRVLAAFDLELVRVINCSPADYLESGHAATNRAEDAETMVGIKQLDSMQACITDVTRRGVPGDFLEAGVWRGGMTIFMRAMLKALGDTHRCVWVADSFEGLPPLDRKQETSARWWRSGDMAEALTTVRNNFARYGLLDDQVRFLNGFFDATLPTSPITQLAILRIDADLYTSTCDVLKHLYPRLAAGGYCIIDDYRNLADCRRAVDEYRQKYGITEPIQLIDSRAVYWRRH
jgi:hypothetical protein